MKYKVIVNVDLKCHSLYGYYETDVEAENEEEALAALSSFDVIEAGNLILDYCEEPVIEFVSDKQAIEVPEDYGPEIDQEVENYAEAGKIMLGEDDE